MGSPWAVFGLVDACIPHFASTCATRSWLGLAPSLPSKCKIDKVSLSFEVVSTCSRSVRRVIHAHDWSELVGRAKVEHENNQIPRLGASCGPQPHFAILRDKLLIVLCFYFPYLADASLFWVVGTLISSITSATAAIVHYAGGHSMLRQQ